MIKPKLQVTGYRGIWGKTMNEQIAFEYARAFAKFLKSKGGKKVLIGRDTRPSGPEIFGSVSEAFEKEGFEIVNADVIPTPSVLLLVRKLEFDGGVMITASHNPPEYNGIKFVVPGGRLTNAEEVLQIENLKNNLTTEEKVLGRSMEIVKRIDNTDLRQIHIAEILRNVNVESIRQKKFKITLDAINSTGAVIGLELLRALGCEVKVINDVQDGTFAHQPEPLEENLGQIMEEVRKNKSDVGFAQDPDADRLGVIDEKGGYVSEELTTTLGVKNILAKTPGSIVIAASSSKVNEEVAQGYGQKTFRSKQGEANVVAKMLEVGSPIGGEGGGGMIYPKVNTSRDSLVGMALILELMARENKKISQIVAEFPKYYMEKGKIPVTENIDSLFKKLREKFTDAKITEPDGIFFEWPDASWFGVRASNTEPIIRLTAEAKSPERLETLFQEAWLTLSGK